MQVWVCCMCVCGGWDCWDAGGCVEGEFSRGGGVFEDVPEPEAGVWREFSRGGGGVEDVPEPEAGVWREFSRGGGGSRTCLSRRRPPSACVIHWGGENAGGGDCGGGGDCVQCSPVTDYNYSPALPSPCRSCGATPTTLWTSLGPRMQSRLPRHGEEVEKWGRRGQDL